MNQLYRLLYQLDTRNHPYIIKTPTIVKPKGEPIVGVIDTLFNEKVYFHEWVDYHQIISKDIPTEEEDMIHGTKVDSIIVDGPSLQPELDDGCGRFQVRHFGVATAGRTSILFLYHTIERIVKDNQDIKVWNLSLGSEKSISPNFISPIAALLDSLQSKYDVIFIIAGTNQPKKGYEPFIGSPADSINSLVVNATTWEGHPPSYARSGPALSFFTKPDVCATGGDEITGLKVYGGPYDTKGYGTSFAAPWITRKMAFLIQRMGLTRETAKALIIDAASGWTPIDAKARREKGFGEVPVRIEEIMQSRKEEIKFVITSQSDRDETYSLNIPVPRHKEKYPFFVKTTLCYFPHCSRNQGVDYTDSELDFHFGRVDSKGNINSINNTQDNEEFQNISESKARHAFNKWDNVKVITERIPKRKIPRTTYGQNDWGIDIIAHERKDKRTEPLPFSVIVTLKEMNNVNRYDEFIRYAQFKHWIVQSIDITHLLHIYEEGEVKVTFRETQE